MFKSLIFISLLAGVKSCKKAEERECLKSTGHIITQEIGLPSFTKLDLNEKIEFCLVQDSVFKVVLNGGENLLNDVKMSVSNDRLTITNENKCNFLRSYKKIIKAEIHFVDITEINYRGTEILSNLDTLNLPWLTLSILNSSGSVKLNLNSKTIIASASGGYGDFVLNGKADYANLYINNNGFCNTYNLAIKDSVRVVSNTMGNMMVNANNTALKAYIKNGGNIFYKGVPSNIILTKNGKGNLLKEN
jgi:hypothetical protein